LSGVSENLNVLIFSTKFLKANFDVLTAHQFQKDITPFARKLAAQNTLKIVGGMASVITMANMLQPGSVELDPRSSNFGKIKVGNTNFDISGSMGSLVTLAARIVPTVHNGKLGFFSKNSKGQITELGNGKYGNRNPMDVVWDFTQGKFAPYAALLRDLSRGRDFQGNQTYVDGHRVIPTLRTVVQAHAPIPAQNFVQTMGAQDAAPIWLSMLADGLGFGANTKVPRINVGAPQGIQQRPGGPGGIQQRAY
jgi:hypothetical protein